MRLAKKPGIRGFAKSSHASMFVIGRYEVAPQTQLFGYRQPLWASVKNRTTDRYDNDKILIRKDLAFW